MPPDSTTARVPNRSESAPQTNAPTPMQSQLMSAAVEIPVRDQPIALVMGCRNTVSEAIAPNPTQVTTIPTPTMIQPYSSLGTIVRPGTITHPSTLCRPALPHGPAFVL